MPLLHRGLEYKSRKSRDTWSNRQVSPWSAKYNRAKASRSLPREHSRHSKHTRPIAQETPLHMDTTRWSIPKSEGLYSLQPKMKKWGSSIQSAKTRPRADCGLDHQRLIAKFSFKLKKVRENH